MLPVLGAQVRSLVRGYTSPAATETSCEGYEVRLSSVAVVAKKPEKQPHKAQGSFALFPQPLLAPAAWSGFLPMRIQGAAPKAWVPREPILENQRLPLLTTLTF